jgi:hypothetical protein
MEAVTNAVGNTKEQGLLENLIITLINKEFRIYWNRNVIKFTSAHLLNLL